MPIRYGLREAADLKRCLIFPIKNVKEEHKYTLKDVYNTDVEWDYKAALIDVEKNIIGLYVIHGNVLKAYSLKTYKKVDDCLL